MVYALWKRNQELQIVSFVIFLVIAMVAIPTVMTGSAANVVVSERGDVNLAMIELHRDAAVAALTVLMLTGTVAWLGLWQS